MNSLAEAVHLKNSNLTNRVKKETQTDNFLRVKSKSEKIVNFLKFHKTENKFKRS